MHLLSCPGGKVLPVRIVAEETEEKQDYREKERFFPVNKPCRKEEAERDCDTYTASRSTDGEQFEELYTGAKTAKEVEAEVLKKEAEINRVNAAEAAESERLRKEEEERDCDTGKGQPAADQRDGKAGKEGKQSPERRICKQGQSRGGDGFSA